MFFLIPGSNTSERLADPATMVVVAKGPGCRRTEEEAQCYLGCLFQVCWRSGKGRVGSADWSGSSEPSGSQNWGPPRW